MQKKTGVFLAAFLGGLLMLPLMARALAPLDSWTKRNNFDATAVLNGVADNGAGTYVAVGDSGVVLTSEDGNAAHWTVRTDPDMTKNLRGITYGEVTGFTGFIAVGDYKTVRKSEDGGITWSSGTGVTGSLKAVAYGAGMFVAVGESGRIYTSTDGNSWSRQAQSLTPHTLHGITYASTGQFLAVGASGVFLVSSDGITWTKYKIPSGRTLKGIAYGASQGLYVAVDSSGTIFVSPDGTTTWTRYKKSWTGIKSSTLFGITYSSSSECFAAVGNKGGVYYSQNGTLWYRAGVPAKIGTIPPVSIKTVLRAIGTDGTIFYAVGRQGTILTSTDGHEFFSTTPSSTGHLCSAVYDGSSRFVAAGQYGNIFTSLNGSVWTESRLTKSDKTYPYIKSVAYGNSLYVAVGTANGTNVSSAAPAVFTSADGLTWTQRSENVDTFAVKDQDLLGVAYGEPEASPLFVAVGTEGTIATTSDGITWNLEASGVTRKLNAVAYGSDVYVAVGNKTILYSADGSTWNSVVLPKNAPNFQGVTFGSGRFVAVASNGAIYVSTDSGVNWERATTLAHSLYGVTYGAHTSLSGYVAVGASGAIYESTNAYSWTKVAKPGTVQTLEAVVFGDSTFVAVGASSMIVQSP